MQHRLPRSASRLALALIIAICASCGAAPNSGALNEQSESDIRAQSAMFEAAWQREDAAAIAGMFTADGKVLAPGAPDIQGSEAVRSWVTGLLDAATIESLEVTPLEVAASGDLAVETGHYDEHYVLSDGNPIDEHGRYITVWRRLPDGTWRIHQFATNLRASAEQ